jgi:hypothetical protein
VKGGLLPLLVIVAVPAFAVGTLVGAGPAAVVGAFVALFGLITSLGGPLWPDLRRLAVLAPVLFGAAVGPRLLAEVSRPAAFALIVVVVTAGALLPLRGPRYTTTALGLGMVTLFAYGIPLLSPASSWQFVLAAAAGVVVALVLRLAFGVADPSKPTRAAVADLLDGDGDVSGPVSLWHADGRRRWLGTVLQEAGRYRLARRAAEALARRSDAEEPALDDLRTRAHEVAERVRAKRSAAPGAPTPDVGNRPLDAAYAALDAIDRAAGARDDDPVPIPPEARQDLRSVPLTGWLRTAQVRHALRTGLGVLAALLLSVRLRPGDPLLPTLLMTTFGVLQASWRDTLGKAWPKVVGLAAGSVVVIVVILLVPTAAYAPVAGVALVIGLSTITTRPALGSAAMVCMSVAMNSSLRHLDPVGTLVEYVLLTAGALVIAVVVGFAVVPGVRPPALRVRVEEAVAATVTAVRSLGGPRGDMVAAQRAALRAIADLTPDRDRLTADQQADLDRFREGLVDLRVLATASVLDPDDEHPAVGRSLAVLEGAAEPGPDDGVLVALAGEVRDLRERLV